MKKKRGKTSTGTILRGKTSTGTMLRRTIL
ncbi:hypothetical protein PFNF54_00255 [Plasmodium falciparum NF54]|uniref:Uncharacterized protein n=1 Tax=Plasmodium falciparum (isolate NF54) TaxID=5843 RepID=W7KDF4_PLAFO|nr:hypothetical protein PFNF54_00255 [Plasmodium falciparum NF54]